MIRRGQSSRTLRVGDLAIGLSGLEGPLGRAIVERYEPFISEEHAEIRIELCDLDESPGETSGYAPVSRVSGDLLAIVCPSWTALFDFERGEGIIAVAPDPVRAVYFVENALRQISQLVLIERGELLLHAAGVVHPFGDRAFAFPGHSGAGKSTISGLLEGAGGHVLSDDLVILDASSERPLLRATPFFGTLPPQRPAPSSIPLEAFHLLEQAPEPALTLIEDASTAVASLLSNVPFTECFDHGHQERLLDTLLRAVRAVPVHALRFRRDLSMLPFLGWRTPTPEGVLS